MMVWPFDLLKTPLPTPPDPQEADHYYDLEIRAATLLHAVQSALEADPANEHMEIARNHASDAFVAVRRANAAFKPQNA